MKMKAWLAAVAALVVLSTGYSITNAMIYAQPKSAEHGGGMGKDIKCNCDKNVTIQIYESESDKTKVIERDSPVCAGNDSTVTWQTQNGTPFSIQFNSDPDEGTPFTSPSVSSPSGAPVTVTGVSLASNPSHSISSFKYKLLVGAAGPSQIIVDPHIIVIGNKGVFAGQTKSNKH